MAVGDAAGRAPFYRRGVFWSALGSAMAIVLGGIFAALDAHGRRHAAEVHSRLSAAGYGRERDSLNAEPIPEEANFAATRFLSRLAEGGIKNGRWMVEHADVVRSTLVPDPGMPGPVRWDAVERHFNGQAAGRGKSILGNQAADGGGTFPWTRRVLRHAEYPASLDARRSEFLDRVPLDLDGSPLRYRQDFRNGRYQLWSVGIDRVDEGGRSVSPGSVGRRRRGSWPWRDDPDWLWSYP